MNMKKRRRQSTSAAIYVVVAALAIIFLAISGISAFLKIADIEVEGASIYSAEEVIEAAGVKPGHNLLFLNLKAVGRRITGDMPYINEIKISRVMPDAIRIEISESLAIAGLSFQGDTLIIDSAGRVLQRTADMPYGLIEIRGFNPVDPEPGSLMKTELGNEMQFRHLVDVLAAIEKSDIGDDVSYIDIASISNITIGYAGRFRVLLGNSTNIQQKLNRLQPAVDVINSERDYGETGLIDMSNSSVEWRFTPDR